jgi:hypothetical protein
MSTSDQDPTKNQPTPSKSSKKKGKKKIKQIQQEKQKEEIANVLKQKMEQISIDFKRNLEIQMAQLIAKMITPNLAEAENTNQNQENPSGIKSEFELKFAEILAKHIESQNSENKLSTASGGNDK